MIAPSDFKQFCEEDDKVECLDIADKVFRLTDSDALQIIGEVSNCRNPAAFQALAATTQKEYLVQLKGDGLSIRQISRLLGVPKGIVERA